MYSGSSIFCQRYLAAILVCIPSVAAGPSVSIPGLGVVLGKTSDLVSSVNRFLGIPYAEAPLADLRWRPPRPHGPWETPLDASKPGNACMQVPSRYLNPKRNYTFSEDCLTLNVAAPASSDYGMRKLPVMVWIHGGKNDKEDSADNPDDVLVAGSGHAVIVVSMNYRLGVLGFMSSKEMQNRDEKAVNLGYQDQRLALFWVKQHITAFGGDAGNVTIFGQSSGGWSVLYHLTSEQSFPLYHRAIVQSGRITFCASAAKAEQMYTSFLNATDCTELTCLLQMSAEDLLKYQSTLPSDIGYWYCIVDGFEMTRTPYELIVRGSYNRVPLVIGATRDEAALFLTPSRNSTKEEMEAYLNRSFDKFLIPMPAMGDMESTYGFDRYPYPKNLSSFSPWYWMQMRIATEGLWSGICGVRRLLQRFLLDDIPVFVYYFSRLSGFYFDAVGSSTAVGPFAVHHADVPYVFGTPTAFQNENYTAADLELAHTMMHYWSNFARTGDPCGPDCTLEGWPISSSMDGPLLVLGDGSPYTEMVVQREACDFWDAHFPHHPGVSKPSILYA